MAIGDKFKTLIDRIQVSPAAKGALDVHASEIGKRLSKVFNLKEMKNYGSHSRDTAVAKYSDMDLFFIVAIDDFKWGGSLMTSDTVLSKFKEQLAGRYPQSAVGRDGHAMVIDFSDGSKIDVLPAVFKGINSHKKPTLWIPNGGGGWLETSPEAHNSYIRSIHDASAHKFKYAVQLMKFWRENRASAVPISSFHMELLFASQGTFSGVKSYAQCIRDAFYELNSRKCAALNDPLGISGRVSASSTDAKLEQAKTAVAFALDKADRALKAEAGRDSQAAHGYWDLVFNGGFPA